MATNARFLELMNKYVQILEDLTVVEHTKFDAIAANDIDLLDKCMKQEEAFSLQIRGFDKKRESLCEEYGFKTFREFIDSLEDMDEKVKMQALFEKLSSLLANLKMINEANNKCTQINLAKINGVIEMLRGGNVKKAYKKDGGIEEDKIKISRFKSQKI